ATRHSCRLSMLCDVGRGEADGSRNRSRASGDPTLQSLVADAGAFLYGHAIRSGKQNVRCLDAYQLERAIGSGKRKVESPASIRKGLESEVTDRDLSVLQYISPRGSADRRRLTSRENTFPTSSPVWNGLSCDGARTAPMESGEAGLQRPSRDSGAF